jgi:hypothetical protein
VRVPRRRYSRRRLNDRDSNGAGGRGVLGYCTGIKTPRFVIVGPNNDFAPGQRSPISLAGGFRAARTGDGDISWGEPLSGAA